MELLIYGYFDLTTNEIVVFKFQYGATNILPSISISSYCIVFKFQYGATNILLLDENVAYDSPFKFQYGATNIRLIIT